MSVINVYLPEFKMAYEQCLRDKKEVFIYKQQEIFVGYAKYLIEYLEMKGDKK